MSIAEASARTPPVNWILQLTAAPKEDGDFSVIVPVGLVVNCKPGLLNVAALAPKGTLTHSANNPAPAKACSLFIIFPTCPVNPITYKQVPRERHLRCCG